MQNYQFEDPHYLWLLLIVPVLAFYQWHRYYRQSPELHFPGADVLAASGSNWLARLRPLLQVFRLAAIALLIIALARPRTTEESTQTKSEEGIDIVIALDISASMLARDLEPDRMEATKRVAADFVAKRPSDRIGVVVYSGESYTQTPLTTDHRIVQESIRNIKYGRIQDGTAIGMGLATAVNRLKDSDAKSKTIILLTDGENNAGQIDPMTAAQLAEEFNIRVYTIGVGTKGMAPTPVGYDFRGNLRFERMPVNIDEELLQDIAQHTGGEYFRATDNQRLQEIYAQIDQMETSKIQEKKFYSHDEKFENFALIAFVLLALEGLLRYTVFRSFV